MSRRGHSQLPVEERMRVVLAVVLHADPSSTKAAVLPSTPAERALVFPATRSHAINNTLGSVTRLYRSSNRRRGSSFAQRCSLVW